MNHFPLVTVNILSFNRKDELRNTLTKVYEQDYKNIEVIVVDNASSDGSSEMVKNEFSSVQLIQMEKNIGIAGWNEGFKVAKGEYVLVLDDDSYPANKFLISRSVNIPFERNIGAIAYKIWNLSSKRYENDFSDKNACPDFIGCGVMVKSELFKVIGYFENLLFLYVHETDYSLRIYDAGYSIKFESGLVINHTASIKNRTSRRRKYYQTRNLLIVIFKHFSIHKIFFRLIRIIIGRLFSGLRQRDFLPIFRGVLSFLLLVPKIIIRRKPVSAIAQRKFNYGNFAGGFHFQEGDWFN